MIILLEAGEDANRPERPAAGGWLLSFDGERRRRGVQRQEGMDPQIRGCLCVSYQKRLPDVTKIIEKPLHCLKNVKGGDSLLR